MKRLLFLLALLWASPALAQGTIVGPGNAILCNAIGSMPVGPTSATVVIPAVAGKTIFICGWHFTNTAAAGTFSITTGTQTSTPCDTGTVTILPPTNVTSTAPDTYNVDYAQTSSKVSQALCITPSAATIAGIVFYSQF
jgi:hypothetical protein